MNPLTLRSKVGLYPTEAVRLIVLASFARQLCDKFAPDASPFSRYTASRRTQRDLRLEQNIRLVSILGGSASLAEIRRKYLSRPGGPGALASTGSVDV